MRVVRPIRHGWGVHQVGQKIRAAHVVELGRALELRGHGRNVARDPALAAPEGRLEDPFSLTGSPDLLQGWVLVIRGNATAANHCGRFCDGIMDTYPLVVSVISKTRFCRETGGVCDVNDESSLACQRDCREYEASGLGSGLL